MFSAKTAARLAEISPRALSYYTGNEIFCPHKRSPRSGVESKYTKEDILVLAIVQRLKQLGASRDFSSRVLSFLHLNRHLVSSSWLVIQDGIFSKPSSIQEVASIVENKGGWVLNLDRLREELGLRIAAQTS